MGDIAGKLSQPPFSRVANLATESTFPCGDDETALLKPLKGAACRCLADAKALRCLANAIADVPVIASYAAIKRGHLDIDGSLNSIEAFPRRGIHQPMIKADVAGFLD